MKKYLYVNVYHDRMGEDFEYVNNLAAKGWRIVGVTTRTSKHSDRYNYDIIYLEKSND